MDSAIASEIAPRKPATVETMRPRILVRRRRCSGRRSRTRMEKMMRWCPANRPATMAM